MGDDSLTDAQQEVIHHLPADKHELSENLGVKPNGVKSRIEMLRDNGVEVNYDREAGQYFLPDQPKTRRVSTKHTGTKTREANDFITELERTILRRLEKRPELVAAQSPTAGDEDMVLHLTDLHIGDVVEDQKGNEIYNTETAKRVVRHVTQKVLDLRELMPGLRYLAPGTHERKHVAHASNACRVS